MKLNSYVVADKLILISKKFCISLFHACKSSYISIESKIISLKVFKL